LEEEKFDEHNPSNLISIKSRGSIPTNSIKFNTKLNKLLSNVTNSNSKLSKVKIPAGSQLAVENGGGAPQAADSDYTYNPTRPPRTQKPVAVVNHADIS
jgi:hypothetical protein